MQRHRFGLDLEKCRGCRFRGVEPGTTNDRAPAITVPCRNVFIIYELRITQETIFEKSVTKRHRLKKKIEGDISFGAFRFNEPHGERREF
jgi:hypothetical protein